MNSHARYFLNGHSSSIRSYFKFLSKGRLLQGRKYTWRKLVAQRTSSGEDRGSQQFSTQTSTMSHIPVTVTHSLPSSETTPRHHHSSSAASSDTEYTNLDTHDLWLPDYEPTPSTLSALHQFGKEMLRLSSGLQNVALPGSDYIPIQTT